MTLQMKGVSKTPLKHCNKQTKIPLKCSWDEPPFHMEGHIIILYIYEVSLPAMQISSSFDLCMSCKVEQQNSQQKHLKQKQRVCNYTCGYGLDTLQIKLRQYLRRQYAGM